MVFVRDGRSEDREDAVAGALHDVAVVAADRVDHQLQCGIDDRARFFGVEVLLQLRRTLDVGEQRRDHLALAFERGCVDLLRGNADWRRRLRPGRFGGCDSGVAKKRGSALATELESRRILESTPRTNQRERLGAMTAEVHAGWIFELALSATHRYLPEPRLAEYRHWTVQLKDTSNLVSRLFSCKCNAWRLCERV